MIVAITDELRDWMRARGMMAKETFDQLTAIADRIDREHRMAMEKVAAEADALPMTDESMAEHGWVRKDKERVISHATIEVTPHIDWSRMADELDEFVEIVRGMAGGAE